MSFGSPYVTLPRFRYVKARSLDEALELLSSGEARVMAGGIGLLNFMKERLITPSVVVDIKGVPELSGLEVSGEVRIGATVRLSEIEESQGLRLAAPTLYHAVRQIADPIIRNSATLVGDVCEAIPWADGPVALSALDASAVVVSRRGSREVKVSELVQGLGQLSISEDELVKEIRFSKRYSGGTYVKFSNGSEYALASVAIARAPEGETRIAVGSVSERPQQFTLEEAGVREGEAMEAVLRKVASYVDSSITAVDDLLGSAEFKKHVVKVLLIEALQEVLAQ